MVTICRQRATPIQGILVLILQLLEAAERVQRVIAEQPTEQPPLPPYPNIHQLSLQGKRSEFG